MGSGPATATGGHFESIAAGAVDLTEEIEEAYAIFVFAGRLDQYGAGAVAEEHAGGAIGVVDNAAHGVRADDQDLLVSAGCHQVRADRGAIHKAGTGGNQIETPRPARANAILHQAGGGWKHVIRRHRANDDGVDFRSFHAALGERAPGGGNGQIGGSYVGGRDVTFADSGAFENPLIIGFDQFLQVVIGKKSGRGIAPQCGDFRSWQIGRVLKDSG